MQSPLTYHEIALLEEGLPRLADWSNRLLVPFHVRRLRHSRVVWINDRWFLQRGLDITEEVMRLRVINWLCDTFGYAAPRPDDPADAYTDVTTTFHADRYGSADSKAIHGGSGRAAIVGCFQAKGVGVTPLAGKGVNWTHSHGCASLEEAVREAIYGEILAAEFPHSAVPILAILDSGLCFSDPSPELPQETRMRRAIVVRPAVIRPAHAERACLFRHSLTGYVNSQLNDVRRCRDVVQCWSNLVQVNNLPNAAELLTRIAEQIAFGQVHRLFNGGYFSSNLTIQGALLDFGATRALPNWANAKTLHHVPGFGEEMIHIRTLIRSLVFHSNKYRPANSPQLSEVDLANQTKHAYEKIFEHECLRVWGLEDTTDLILKTDIVKSMRQYFALQQRLRVNYRTRIVRSQSWLYEAIAFPQETGYESERTTICTIEAAFKAHLNRYPASETQQQRMRMTALRFLMPRIELDRDPLQQRIFQIISPEGFGSRPNAHSIRNMIRLTVGISRRHWPELPANLSVVGHLSSEGSSALLCQRVSDKTTVLWLEGSRCGNKLRLFDHWLSAEDLHGYDLKQLTHSWNAQIPASSFESSSGYLIKIRNREISIPKLQIIYSSYTENEVTNRTAVRTSKMSSA